jgi:hypothetical protein
VPAPVVAVIEVAETTWTPVAATPPIVTVAPAAKLVPVMVTLVPPASGPRVGEMAATVGAGIADVGADGVLEPPAQALRTNPTTRPSVSPAYRLGILMVSSSPLQRPPPAAPGRKGSQSLRKQQASSHAMGAVAHYFAWFLTPGRRRARIFRRPRYTLRLTRLAQGIR